MLALNKYQAASIILNNMIHSAVDIRHFPFFNQSCIHQQTVPGILRHLLGQVHSGNPYLHHLHYRKLVGTVLVIREPMVDEGTADSRIIQKKKIMNILQTVYNQTRFRSDIVDKDFFNPNIEKPHEVLGNMFILNSLPLEWYRKKKFSVERIEKINKNSLLPVGLI